jgi:hypothetical protein
MKIPSASWTWSVSKLWRDNRSLNAELAQTIRKRDNQLAIVRGLKAEADTIEESVNAMLSEVAQRQQKPRGSK